MDLQVNLTGRGDLVARIYRELLDAILDGRLAAGERLPPTRELAGTLDVSRNTVAAAYERLVAEGFLVGRVGAGTFVTGATARRGRRAPRGTGTQVRKVWQDIPALESASPKAFDFSVGVPDGRLFPIETWRRLIGHTLRANAVDPAGYGDPAGHPRLRAAIAHHLGASRSVRADASDVLVTQARNRRSTSSAGCSSSPAAAWPWRNRAIPRRAGCSGRSARGWPACRSTGKACASTPSRPPRG
ncbi:hypothetical protein GCM10017788_08320 [Amycolatopsis acidiphila]|nr:hypothetical protein GCM10017788_08320 [Amycolatopsis acidiphila]